LNTLRGNYTKREEVLGLAGLKEKGWNRGWEPATESTCRLQATERKKNWEERSLSFLGNFPQRGKIGPKWAVFGLENAKNAGLHRSYRMIGTVHGGGRGYLGSH